MDESLKCGDRLGRREGAVAGPVHEHLAQHVVVARAPDHARVCILVGHLDEAVARRVQREHRDAQVAVVGDVLGNVRDGAGVGGDALSAVQLVELLVEVKAGGGVQRFNLGEVHRVRELDAVVDAGIPGEVASRSELQLIAAEEAEKQIGTVLPRELVALLGCKVVGRRFWARRRKPSGDIRQSG